MTPKSLLAALIALLPLGAAAQVRDQTAPMAVVQDLDLNRYLGVWYEIARFPNRFEKGCEDVTASYALRDDGAISVVNACTKAGKAKSIKGKAWVVEPGKLKVTFVPLLGSLAAGDYWVLDVTADYQMAVVGAPEGGFGWILARSPQLAPERLDRAMKVLTMNGYDVTKLEMVKQGGGS